MSEAGETSLLLEKKTKEKAEGANPAPDAASDGSNPVTAAPAPIGSSVAAAAADGEVKGKADAGGALSPVKSVAGTDDATGGAVATTPSNAKGDAKDGTPSIKVTDSASPSADDNA